MIDPGSVFWLTAIALGLAVAIVLLVWSWFQIRAWCWDGDDPAADAGAFLTALRESAREGDVSKEEFRSIQSRLASRIEGTVPTAAGPLVAESSSPTPISDERPCGESEDTPLGDSRSDPMPDQA